MFYTDFDDFKTRTGYDIDGTWYPRVTSILSIKAKPGLLHYYASMPNFKTAQLSTERSAEEGTAVHEAIEAMLEGKTVPIPSSIHPAIEAFMEFRRNNDIVPLKIEERIVSRKHRYAGTIDVLAEVNGVIGVLDIKTSTAIYRDYGMQTAAYIEALREDKDIPAPKTSWVLRIDQSQKCIKCGASFRHKGGNSKVRGGTYRCLHEWSEIQGEYEFKEMDGFEHNFGAFLAAKKLWEWEHKEYLGKLL